MINNKSKSKSKIQLANFFRLLLTAFCLLVFTTEINSTIRYVSPTGNNIPPYLTWEDAANSLQDCIDVSEFGDTIYVANGVYEEQVVMINGLSLIGAGTDSCIIDTRALITSISTEAVVVADSCLFTGFNIWVYYTWELGRGINANVGNGNNIITNNKITRGSRGITPGLNSMVYKNTFENINLAVRLLNSSAVIRKNIIYIDQNSQTSLGAIDLEAINNNHYPVVDSNYIITNRNGIVKAFGTTPTIINNIIILKNGTGMGLGGSPSDSGYVHNNLIISDPIGVNGILNYITHSSLLNNYISGYFDSPQSLQRALRLGSLGNDIVKNNVVANAVRGVEMETGSNPNLIFQYNNVWNTINSYTGFTPDSTNLSVDPMIVNDDTTQGELDFHLQAFSPMIDAGDPEMIDRDSSIIDIGLYGGLWGESYKYVDLSPRPPRNLTGEVDSGMITVRWNPNTEADFNYYNLFRDTSSGYTPDSSNFVMSLTDTFYTHIYPPEIERFYYKLTAVDNQENESSPSVEIKVIVTSLTGDEPAIISSYILYQSYPNPFNPSTKIAYKLKERGYVKLYVYSVTGELVSVLVNQTQEVGYYEVEFDVKRQMADGRSDLAGGVYIYQIMVRNENNITVFTDMKKMLLIK